MIPLKEKIGQMLIMGFNGQKLDEASDLTRWLQYAPLGGVLFFDYDMPHQQWGKNIFSIEQIHSFIKDLQAFNQTQSPSRPDLFFAIDYEGGAVDRLKHITNIPQTQSPKHLASLSPEAYQREVSRMAATLESLGFNLNFAPLVDLDFNLSKGIISSLGRSFAKDPERVASLAKQWVKIFQDHHIASCYKHFPGHGSAEGDTHTDFVDVTNSFDKDELLPYEILCKDSSLPYMVMTAHVINRKLDATGVPATLSPIMITEQLRVKLGYDGVIISDDLQMAAISDHYTLKEALTLTINAGCDMLIFGNQLGFHDAIDLIELIEAQVNDQAIEASTIDNAYQRIMRLKSKLSMNPHEVSLQGAFV